MAGIIIIIEVAVLQKAGIARVYCMYMMYNTALLIAGNFVWRIYFVL